MINKYLEVKNQQQDNGSFLDFAGVQSVFYTSLVLSCLNSCKKDEEAYDIKKKAVDFLLSKKDDNWKFSENLGINFYTLCALAEYDKNLFDGQVIAKILNELVSAEIKEGGPYFSFLNKKDDTTDLFGNTAVAYFLFLQEVELPELTNLIETAVENKNFKSRFFKSDFPVIYFISKFYKGKKVLEIIKFLEKSNPNDFFDKILVVNALLNFGCPIKKTKDELGQEFELGQNNCPNKSSLLLNTVFYLEAIEKIDLGTKNKEGVGTFFNDNERYMIDKIMELASQRFSQFPEEFKKCATDTIKRIIDGNADKQMSLMPYYTKLALGKNADKVSDNDVTKMGLANIFFWTAFIIYDDFWDEDELADPHILPAANLYARSFVDYFDFLLPEDTGFRTFFHKLMDNLDAANTWENIYCRAKVEGSKFIIPEKLPDYKNYELKYQPASGHILGPVAMLVSLGYSLNSPEVKNFILYFKNYLIAMQINDDAHDWEEDLRRGHISTVVDLLLRDLNWQKKEIDLEKDLDELKKVFWFKTLSKAEELAVYYTKKSRQALLCIDIFEDLSPLEKFIDITENIAKKALKEQEDSVKFLQNFN